MVKSEGNSLATPMERDQTHFGFGRWTGLTLGNAAVMQVLLLPPPAKLWEAFVDLMHNGSKCRSLLDHFGFSVERLIVGTVAGSAMSVRPRPTDIVPPSTHHKDTR
jgi:hypothetical protein